MIMMEDKKALPLYYRDILSNHIKLYEHLMHLLHNAESVSIKLVISKLETWEITNWLLRSVGVYPEFGRTHLDLIVGNVIIGWNSSSLCFPRECRSERSVIALDIYEIRGKSKVSKAISNLAQEIVKWNAGATYGKLDNTARKFAEACLCSMNIQKSFRGQVHDYFTNLYTEHPTPVITLSEHDQKVLAKCLPLLRAQNGKITFRSHDELDEFYYTVISHVPEFFISGERRFLVS
jgi:hypothetical protein